MYQKISRGSMKNLISIMLLGLLCSCSFKSDKDSDSVSLVDELSTEDMTSKDSDGDRITDQEEIDLGLDRFIANIPKVKANFLQDYKIQVIFEDESEFIIDTETARDNPDFKYRVGELFIKKNSFKNAAKIGRYAGVSWGVIGQKDISWVQYPDIDKEFYFSKVREYDLLAKAPKSITISLDNNLKLQDSQLFNEIKDLELNFYYYDFKVEDYVLLHTHEVNQVFQSGVIENFSIDIENVPVALLEDTYLRHGQFIISEIKDFYIPKLDMKYSELLKSVKSKTVAVYKSNPIDSDLSYVAVRSIGDTFIDLSKRLFQENIEVADQKLNKLEQFSNNLEPFESLNQLKGIKKQGNWFVMTNKLRAHYLTHKYKKGEMISLVYVSGDELASQGNETFFSKTQDVYSTKDHKLYPMGNINKNSQIEFSVFLKSLKGKILTTEEHRFQDRPPRCRSRNCSGNKWSIWANYSVSKFSEVEQELKATTYNELKPAFELLINNTLLDIDTLIEQNLLTISFREDQNGSYLNFKIHGLENQEAFVAGKENVFFLKVLPISKGSEAEGVKITDIGGRKISVKDAAGIVTYRMAAKHKTKLAVTSKYFDHWNRQITWWGKPDPNKFIPEKGLVQEYWNGVVVDIVSNITNNYN